MIVANWSSEIKINEYENQLHTTEAEQHKIKHVKLIVLPIE
jgi:hypothetical protein